MRPVLNGLRLSQNRSASGTLPRHKRRDDDRLTPSCSVPVLPSLSLSLKGAKPGTHVYPQMLATQPQTLSHYDQMNQLQAAMRDKLRSETAALSEQLALALARAECAEAQLRDMLESRRRSAAAAAPAPAPVPAPPTREAAVAEEAVAEAAALRSEVERLQSEAVTLRRTLLLERQRASRVNSVWHSSAEHGASLCMV